MGEYLSYSYSSWKQGETKNWFAVYTFSRHEKRVEQQLRVRDIESYLPLYQTPRKWRDGSKGLLQLPLFPNYLFVHIGCGGRVPVLKVPGVISVVGTGPQPCPVPDSYIGLLRDGLQHGKIKPHPNLAAGARVQVHRGAMTGIEGVLLRHKNVLRVVLSIEMIRKSVALEVSIEDIKPI